MQLCTWNSECSQPVYNVFGIVFCCYSYDIFLRANVLLLIIIIVYKVFFLIVNLSPIVVVLFALFIVCIKIFMHPLIVSLLIACITYKWLHAYTCNDYSNMKTLLSP